MPSMSLSKGTLCMVLLYIRYKFQLVSCDTVLSWTFQTHTNPSASTVQAIRAVQGLRSKVECARACACSYLGERCQSVQFHESSGTCQLLATKDEVNVEEQEEGWSAYKVVQFAIVPDPSTNYLATDAYKADIVGGMRSGTRIYVSGVFHQNPLRLALKLKWGPSLNSNEALHFDVRFHIGTAINQVARNYRKDLMYGLEEAEPSGTNFPFHPGQSFEIEILAENTRFQVLVDGEHFVYYNYQVPPLENVVLLTAEGSVVLNLIKIS